MLTGLQDRGGGEAVVSARYCQHVAVIRGVLSSAPGDEECLKLGDSWLHLRVCRTCGHVGCCDQSPNRHATKHFRVTKHPVIEVYDPPEGWGWCYVDEVMFDLSDRPTPHLSPIPRYYWGLSPALVDAGLRVFAAFLRRGRIVRRPLLPAAVIGRWIVDVEGRTEADPLGQIRIGE